MTSSNITLGVDLHELICSYVTWLKELIIDCAQGHVTVHCANIMYNIPRIGATFHIAPINLPDKPPIVGTQSPFFKAIRKLGLSFPTSMDLDALLQYGLRCQLAVSPARFLFEFFDSNDVPQLPIRKCLSQPQSSEEMIRGLLEIFSNLDTNEHILWKFAEQGCLSYVVQCLLSFLPQFDHTKAAILDRKEDTPPSDQIVNGIYWIPQDLKIEIWKANAKNDSPRDRAFWLLSAVESLQWQEKSEFGLIDSLYSFLVEDDQKEGKGTDLIPSIRTLKFFLEPIKLYFNVDTEYLSPEKKRMFATTLRARLRNAAFLFADFAALVSTWLIQQKREVLSVPEESLSMTAIEAILNLSNPELISFRNKYKQEKLWIKRYDLTQFDCYNKEKTEPASLFTMLNRPLGLYDEISMDEHSTSQELHKMCLHIPQLGTIELHFLEPLGFPEDTQKESSLSISRYLHHIIAPTSALVSTIVPPNNGDLDSWYSKAFDEYYVYFDKSRQENKQIKEFKLRKDKESFFYKSLLKEVANQVKRKITVLDIGVGYGRLAKQIIDKGIIDGSSYHGLDISSTMLNECRKTISEANLQQGEMSRLAELFKDESFDVIIFSYTTFGCYADDRDASVLECVKNILKPYGLLIIEQHNPKRRVDTPVLVHGPLQVGQKRVLLIKTTHKDQNLQGEEFWDYTGKYKYYELIEEQDILLPLKVHSYRVRLYTERWMSQALQQDFIIDIYADFDKERPYDKYQSDATFMIYVAWKLPFKIDDLQNAIMGAEEVLVWAYNCGLIKREDFLYKLNENSFNLTEEMVRNVLKLRPTIEDVELLKKNNRTHNENLDAVEILRSWFNTNLEENNRANKS